MLTFANFVWSF